jgi:hypothetical protein
MSRLTGYERLTSLSRTLTNALAALVALASWAPSGPFWPHPETGAAELCRRIPLASWTPRTGRGRRRQADELRRASRGGGDRLEQTAGGSGDNDGLTPGTDCGFAAAAGVGDVAREVEWEKAAGPGGGYGAAQRTAG